jgi:hypothetical protein
VSHNNKYKAYQSQWTVGRAGRGEGEWGGVEVKGQVRFTWLFVSTNCTVATRITVRNTLHYTELASIDGRRGSESHVFRFFLPPARLYYYPNREIFILPMAFETLISMLKDDFDFHFD